MNTMTQLKKLYSLRTLLREYMISDSAFIYKQQFDWSEKKEGIQLHAQVTTWVVY
jgi:hypothetical protein